MKGLEGREGPEQEVYIPNQNRPIMTAEHPRPGERPCELGHVHVTRHQAHKNISDQ